MIDGWTKLKGAAKYTGLSERTLRTLLKDGLRHSRLRSGTILLRYAWLDEFFSQYEVIENEADELVDAVCKEIA